MPPAAITGTRTARTMLRQQREGAESACSGRGEEHAAVAAGLEPLGNDASAPWACSQRASSTVVADDSTGRPSF
jgi:hypothetical protein